MSEQTAKESLINNALMEAWLCLDRALYWQRHNALDVVRQYMTEYHVHVACAYALNEILGANIDVYTATHWNFEVPKL